MPNIENISPDALERAARIIRRGGLVAFPTETVYGLGADAGSGEAVALIFAAKGRPRFNPLIVHVEGIAQAEALGEFGPGARRLADAFWPGPLSLVLPRRASARLADLVSAGLPTVALRVPSHPVARALIAAAGVPIAAPSANRSGGVSATTAQHVAADFGDSVDLILDGGASMEGLESTVIGFGASGPVLLRAGAIPRERIEAVLETALAAPAAKTGPQAPGMLASHYAPRARLRLEAAEPRRGEAFLAFGPHESCDADCLNLSESGNLREAAANFFAHLRRLDAAGPETIAVAPIPEQGLGEAINDRLRRAAAPRPA
jgi:L-threonylcarbamoyladenylate synthase